VNFQPALITEEHPLELKEVLPPEVLQLDPTTAKVEKPIQVELTITKDEENFLALGWATTALSLQCGRCAGPLPWPIRARVEHLFEAPHPNTLDLTPLIREDILLELPLNAVCQLGADGRCPVTGELYQPPPETSGTLVGEEVWEALSKIKTKE
jgi:uncharacterized metal-binding protein YceD (DUF177 family)